MFDLPGRDPIASLVTSYLDVQSKRAQLVSSNIANADTPGFTAKELDFASFMRSAAHHAIDDGAELDLSLDFERDESPTIVNQQGQPKGIDGNNVDAGREMSTLADAGMQYLSGTQLLQSRLKALRLAIREGK